MTDDDELSEDEKEPLESDSDDLNNESAESDPGSFTKSIPSSIPSQKE